MGGHSRLPKHDTEVMTNNKSSNTEGRWGDPTKNGALSRLQAGRAKYRGTTTLPHSKLYAATQYFSL
jgi:hypothetical protein